MNRERPTFKGSLIQGDCREVLKSLDENSIDACVTDPPYELGFMGKRWDASGIAYDVALWKLVFRVLKPGAHLLAFGGTRTYHRMVCAIEDAGFEIRDQIQWLYGSGFPKSLDVSKAIDKVMGAERTVVGKISTQIGNKLKSKEGPGRGGNKEAVKNRFTGNLLGPPVLDEAKAWSGWGTALKPANEPICVARKPLSEKTVAENVLKWGTGALNIDGCRVGTEQITVAHNKGDSFSQSYKARDKTPQHSHYTQHSGRWPANVILDEEAGKMLDEQSGERSGCKPHTITASEKTRQRNKIKGWGSVTVPKEKFAGFADSGGASRFFYCPKASRSERNAGLEGMEKHTKYQDFGLKQRMENGAVTNPRTNNESAGSTNHHPTVKPIKLMEYLVKLVTPPGGKVLDPFMGSGTTGIACKNLGFEFVGIEQNEEYFAIAEKRLCPKTS